MEDKVIGTSFVVDKPRLAVLRTIAERYGFLIVRGPAYGRGSVSMLLRAIADGEYEIVRKGERECKRS